MIRDQIKSHPFFAGLHVDAVDALAAMSEIERFPAGTWIAREGHVAEHMFALVRGRAMVEAARPGGRTTVLNTVDAGEVVGWSWLFAPHRWHFDVLAVDEVEALAVRAEDLREMLDREPVVGSLLTRRLAQVMAARLTAARLQLLDVYGSTDA